MLLQKLGILLERKENLNFWCRFPAAIGELSDNIADF